MGKKVRNLDGGGVAYFCPGCKCYHAINTPDNMRWQFNGDVDKPTITPSVWRKGHADGRSICHHFVRDGKIRYLNDCEHHLAGQTVEMEDEDD